MRVLYDNPFSPFARKVRMVLEHKGLAFEASTGSRPRRATALAAVNGRLEVPGARRRRRSWSSTPPTSSRTSSTAIPERPVYPADPAQRVRARGVGAHGGHAPRRDPPRHLRLHVGVSRARRRRQGSSRRRARISRRCTPTSSGRSRTAGPYVCGELSIADLALFPHLTGVKLLGVSFSEERHPRLLDWYRRMRTLDICRGDVARVQTFLAALRRESAGARSTSSGAATASSGCSPAASTTGSSARSAQDAWRGRAA